MNISICYVLKRKPLPWSRQKTKFAPDAQLLIHLGAKSLDLSFQVDDFKRKCTNWEKYDPELNALNVIHTKKLVSHSSLSLGGRTNALQVVTFPTTYSKTAKRNPFVHKRRELLTAQRRSVQQQKYVKCYIRKSAKQCRFQTSTFLEPHDTPTFENCDSANSV